jgi:kumamolisin
MKFRTYYKKRVLAPHAAPTPSYTPLQLASFYGIPTTAKGAGKKIAVIELGGGFTQSALDTYFKSLGLAVAPVVFHGIDGSKNTPGDPNGADGEVQLDLCVIGAMAPAATMHCYMAPNSDKGFLDAINQAIADKMDCISISWGGPEDNWDAATITAFNQAFHNAALAGITVTAAAGDNGSGDGEIGDHVDFPASSPYVTACGGTSVPHLSPTTEVVWNDGTDGGATGGGISALFPIPDYQKNANVPGGAKRGVPDVAGNADPNTGWIVEVDGTSEVIGGTSAVAPMWAAIAACVSAAIGKNVGFLNPFLYALPATSGALRDIPKGNNGTYIARVGWDACTGLGVPVVSALITALNAAPTPPAPVPPAPVPPAPTPPTPPAPKPPVPVPPAPVPPAPTPVTRTIVVQGTGIVITVDGKKI